MPEEAIQIGESCNSYEAGELLYGDAASQAVVFHKLSYEMRKIIHQPKAQVRELKLYDSRDPLFRRKKDLDKIDLACLVENFPNLERLSIRFPLLGRQALSTLVPAFHSSLLELNLEELSSFGNYGMEVIVGSCSSLRAFRLSGCSVSYNKALDKEGISCFERAEFQLQVLELKYIEKVGDEEVRIIANCFRKSLRRLSIVRNCLDHSLPITDLAFEAISSCAGLTELNITFSRKLKESMAHHLARLPLLTRLVLADCLFQYSLEPLCKECVRLQEVDFSGDCWFRVENLALLSHHKGIRVFRLGHLEHSDMCCKEAVKSGEALKMLVETFGKPGSFPALETLYLEENCLVTYEVDFRLNTMRPGLNIRYTFIDSAVRAFNDAVV